MQTKFARHMKALHMLAGEIGSKGEEDSRYEQVYMKLSDALDAAENAGLICNEDTEEGAPRIVYTAQKFGKDSRQGVHLLQPDAFELERAKESAAKDCFSKIYIHEE